MLLGNHLTEHSLVLYFAKAEAHYSTAQVSPCSLTLCTFTECHTPFPQGSTPYDELMHVVDFFGDSIKLVAEKSHGYQGPTMDETYVET